MFSNIRTVKTGGLLEVKPVHFALGDGCEPLKTRGGKLRLKVIYLYQVYKAWTCDGYHCQPD